jgi:hypothetical protein
MANNTTHIPRYPQVTRPTPWRHPFASGRATSQRQMNQGIFQTSHTLHSAHQVAPGQCPCMIAAPLQGAQHAGRTSTGVAPNGPSGPCKATWCRDSAVALLSVACTWRASMYAPRAQPQQQLDRIAAASLRPPDDGIMRCHVRLSLIPPCTHSTGDPAPTPSAARGMAA